MKKKENHVKENIIKGMAVGAAVIGATVAMVNPDIRRGLKKTAGRAMDGIREFADDPQATINRIHEDLKAFIDRLELEKLDAKFRAEVEKQRDEIEKQITEFADNDGEEIVAKVKESFNKLREYVEKHS